MTGGVSMRGFRERADVEAVWRLIDARVAALPAEEIPLAEAAGRTLAGDALSEVDVPAFARAAMDGYAVVAEETFGTTPEDPRPFRIVGEAYPARFCAARVTGDACVRIMTGAPMPAGADAVVPVEQTSLERGLVRVASPVTPGKNVGQIGEDISAGTRVLAAGRILRPQDLGVLSSIGVARVSVVRRPVVTLVLTGQELLPAGTRPAGHLIADANSPMVEALVARDGGIFRTTGILPDDRELIRSALLGAAEVSDLLLVSGGSSVGVEDFVPSILIAEGTLDIHGVAMRPSSPAGLGFLLGRPVFLLPGNPVSCLCAYDFFAGRAIRRMVGRDPGWPYRRIELPLSRKIASELGRTDYVRVKVAGETVEPLAIRGAAILTSTTRADGFVIVPRDLEGYPEGSRVTVHLY